MKIPPHRNRKHYAFTLLELTFTMSMSIGIAVTLLSMLQQQVTLNRVFGQFSFLRDEAPQVNILVSNIVNQSDSYRIFEDLDDAKTFTDAVRDDGGALRLRLDSPDGITEDAIIAFENRNGQKQLNYYFKGNSDSEWGTDPNWTISTAPDDVEFDNTSGILLVKMSGPNGEEITYSGNPE